MKVSIHQESVLSLFFFVSLLHHATKGKIAKIQHDILFSDDIVLMRENLKEMEVNSEVLTKVLEKKKIARQ